MDVDARRALLKRIQREAQAYANADETTRLIRWGRVMGLLEARRARVLVGEGSG
jgi:hypothetical protein